MRRNGRIPRTVRHLDSVERLGQRTDLVHLDEDRVGAAHLDALAQEIHVRYEQVVADELAFVAQLAREQLPALPVVLGHAVLDRVDRVFGHEPLEVLDLLLRRTLGALLAFELRIVVYAVLIELRRSAVHADRHVAALTLAAGFISGSLDGFDDRIERVLRTVQRGSETALVAHGRRKAAVVEHLLQVVEHLGAHAHGLLERRSAHGADHELLKSDGSVGVRTAVDDVHHRHGQTLGVRTADITVERHAEVVGGGTGHGQRNAEDGIGAQIRLGLGAVELDHRLVDADLIGYVHADDGGCDHLVHVPHGFLHALAQIAALVAVAQFERLVLAGRGTARNGCAAEGAGYGTNFDLHGRITSRIEDFPCMNLYNLHTENNL